MSDILVKGMEMPTTYPLTVTIYPDGQVLSETVGAKDIHGEAVPVPPHGRLIDADAFLGTIRPICDEDANAACTFETVKRLMIEHINDAPTIIPAEEGET